MGYFEGLTRGCFKQSADGRHIFYPWGAGGRGYYIPSDKELELLKRGVKAYFIYSLGLIGAVLAFLILEGYPTEYVFYVAPIILPYILWTLLRCRHLQRADVRLTFAESLDNKTSGISWILLWLMEIVLVLGALLSLSIPIFKPDEWLEALSSFVVCGGASYFVTMMMISKRRQGRDSDKR